jgi:glycosyltransferase involved in cell wall biosynthesis
MKRAVHVLRKLDPGGIELWLLDVVLAGGVSGYQLEILVETSERGVLEDQFRAAGVPIHRWRPGQFVRLFRLLRGCWCVHSHVHAFSGAVLAIAAFAGVPIRVAHSHTTARETYWWRRGYHALMTRLIAWFATEKLAVSGAAGESLFGSPDAFLPFSCYRELPKVRPIPKPTGQVVIGHVGRFVPEKNHALLERLLTADPGFQLLLCGDGPLRERFEGNPRIQFASSPAQVLERCSCFVFPSLVEGFGLALIEAQAAGLPCVVSSRIPREAHVLPELLTVLEPEAPISEWAEAVSTASHKQPLPAAADRVRSAGFTVERGIAQLESLYAGHS